MPVAVISFRRWVTERWHRSGPGICLLMFTGCRSSEIVSLRWEDVDLAARELRLRDVRLHDLRHSFASRALAMGESLPMIAKLLGATLRARCAMRTWRETRCPSPRPASPTASLRISCRRRVMDGWPRRRVSGSRGRPWPKSLTGMRRFRSTWQETVRGPGRSIALGRRIARTRPPRRTLTCLNCVPK